MNSVDRRGATTHDPALACPLRVSVNDTAERIGFPLQTRDQPRNSERLFERNGRLCEQCFRGATVTSERSLFVVAGNMRTGTTYALLSLASLPDVAGDYEIVFFPEFPLSSHHICIPNGMSARPIINAISETASVVGSKLTLGHDYRYMRDAGVLSNFIRSFDGLRVVHVIRPYFEQIVSRTGRFEHIASEALSDTQLISQETSKPKAQLQRQRSSPLSLQDCTSALVCCLFGDALIHAIGQRTDYLLVRYEEIATNLPTIARFIGSRASADEVEEIMRSPPIRPTRRGREDLLEDPEKTQNLCNGFDQKAASFLGTRKPFEEIFRMDGNSLEFL